MKKIIIGLVGPIASGKGVIKTYLQKEYGATEHRFSTMLRDVLDRMHIEQSRENMQTISTTLRQKFGEDLLAKVLTNDVSEDQHDLIVIDGIRRMADIQYLAALPNFILVAVSADEKIRYERVVKRNENPGDADKSFSDFQKDSRAETELTIPGVMSKAKITIENNGNLEELYNSIDKLVTNLRR